MLTRAMVQIAANLVLYVGGALAFGSGLMSWGLKNVIFARGATAPDHTSGLLFILNQKGIDFYMSATERNLLLWSDRTFPIALAVAAVSIVCLKLTERRPRPDDVSHQV